MQRETVALSLVAAIGLFARRGRSRTGNEGRQPLDILLLIAVGLLRLTVFMLARVVLPIVVLTIVVTILTIVAIAVVSRLIIAARLVRLVALLARLIGLCLAR
ncbi:hypothetical protein, partial [Pseudorhodoplanes sp.]|uniref:hypothetical protein n=1 Tax=Pseudorhodoplanes sp. TaxID=1934341 RepID=UPI003D095F66